MDGNPCVTTMRNDARECHGVQNTTRCFFAKSTMARTWVTKIDAASLGGDGVSSSDAGAEVRH